MQVKKQQLELDLEQQTGSKLGKEYIKSSLYIVTLLVFFFFFFPSIKDLFKLNNEHKPSFKFHFYSK